MLKRMGVTGLVVAMGLTLAGCQSMSQVQKGAAIGAGVGGVAGLAYNAITDGHTGYFAAGLMGATGGGLVGALWADHANPIEDNQDHAAEIAERQKALDEANEKLRECERKGQSLGQDVTNLENQKKELERQVATLIEELNKWKGSRVEITIDNAVLFNSGSATISDNGRGVLDDIAKRLKEAHAGKLIEVEGHTDTDPIRASNWKSNWELGAARALAVLHYLQDKHGIAGKALSATTYGEYQPVSSDKNKNRRSVVVIYTARPVNN
jgi:chemotaxis protein MotB